MPPEGDQARNGADEGLTESARLELAVEVARTFGSVRLRLTGTSMMPAIHPGDLVSIGRVSLGEVLPGEIVVFSRWGRLFAHRVVARGGDSLAPYVVTRGDRLPENDPPVFQSELLGRVTAIERGRRRVRFRHWLAARSRMLGCLLHASERATIRAGRVTAVRRASPG